MKNVPVKFRGIVLATGETIFGDLVHDESFTYIGNPSRNFFNICLVDPDSVAQLIGYDCNGNEIYEGDILINEKGTEFQAVLKGLSVGIDNRSYRRYLDDPIYKKYYRLKGKDYEELQVKGDSDE